MLNQGIPAYLRTCHDSNQYITEPVHQMQLFHIRTRMNNAGSPVSRYGNFEENTTQCIQPNIETEKVTNFIIQH
jgi:hypothetical protein